MIEYRNSKVFGKNWAWLVEDRLCWRFLNKPAHMIDGFEYHAANIPHEVMEHVPEDRRDLVIQAGGNSGLYPRIYSQYFKEVITFEPNDDWRECLEINCSESKNVRCHPVCLGAEPGKVSLIAPKGKHGVDNLGALHVDPNSEGIIPVITIDSLDLSPDLIHLDIEGFEGPALLGAMETIKRSSPIIVTETNKSGDKFGWPDERVVDLIKSFGYEMIYDWQHDKAFARIDT